MEKNRLDDFFKKKLDHRTFEPSEDFWKEAEAMIDAQESDQRNWRYFWWSLGLFMLIGTAITWFNWDRWDPANQQQSTIATTELSQNTTAQTTAKNKESTTTQIEKKELNKQEKGLDSSGNNLENSKESKNNNNSNNPLNNTKSNLNKTRNKKSSTVETNATTVQKTLSKGEIVSSTQTKKNTSTTFENNSNDNSSINSTSTDVVSNKLPPAINSKKNNQEPSITFNNVKKLQKDFTTKPQGQDTKIKDPVDEPSRQGEAKSQEGKPKVETPQNKNTTKPQHYNTIPLSSLSFTSDVPERLLELGNPRPYKSAYPLPRRRRFNLGFQAGISLFPAKSDEQLLTGYEAGLTASYQIGKQWSIGADLLFVRNTGTFDTLGSVVETVYGFGKETTSYTLQRSSLDFIEVPFYVQFKTGKHLFEGGLGFNYLMGVRGALETTRSQFPWERSDREILEETTSGSETWITKNGFPNLHTNAFLGYRFQLSERLDFGARARFVFYKEPSSSITLISEETKVSYKELRPITFRVNLRYYFVK